MGVGDLLQEKVANNFAPHCSSDGAIGCPAEGLRHLANLLCSGVRGKETRSASLEPAVAPCSARAHRGLLLARSVAADCAGFQVSSSPLVGPNFLARGDHDRLRVLAFTSAFLGARVIFGIAQHFRVQN